MRLMLLLTLFSAAIAHADDWVTWRANPARDATTAESLPTNLRPAWTRELAANHVAWQEDERLQFDASIKPLVAEGVLVAASSRTDSIEGFDAATGEPIWRRFVGGPIRVAPYAHESHVYFGADDGNFYCISLKSGEIVWRINAAPTGRHVLANERLASVWPVRGGPVVHKGRLYFTAGVWPFEGSLLYTVDLAASAVGEPSYTTEALGDVAPQGALVVVGDRLFIPAGRAKPTCIDLATGERVGLRYDSRGLTDYRVTSGGELLFQGAAVFQSAANTQASLEAVRPVSDGQTVYFGRVSTNGNEADDGQLFRTAEVVACRLSAKTSEAIDRRGDSETKTEYSSEESWTHELGEVSEGEAAPRVHLLAGDQVYASRDGEVFSLPREPEADAKPSWRADVEGETAEMLAADGRLYVVTREGRVYCFADQDAEPVAHATAAAALPQPGSNGSLEATLDRTPDLGGYALVYGAGDGQVVEQLVADSAMHVIVVDPSAARVRALRESWQERGLYGVRVAALVEDRESLRLPPYFASLIAIGDPRLAEPDDVVRSLFENLRPYGGLLAVPASSGEEAAVAAAVGAMSGAACEFQEGFAFVTRQGALEGASDWSHEYGDASNTLMSSDDRVRAPLGLLWYGGPAGSGELYFNRHYWGPGPTVVEGRMFVQGPQRFAAIDIYTGRVLWKLDMRDGSGPGRRGNFFEVENPGYHYTATPDSVYLVYPEVCLRLDPATGEVLAEFLLPEEGAEWGKVRAVGDQLIVPVFRDGLPKQIASVDRFSGETQWISEAAQSAPLITIGDGKVMFFDGMLVGFYDAWSRRGLVPDASAEKHIAALDLATGEEVWRQPTDMTATWLSCSEENRALVTSNKEGVAVLSSSDGATLWEREEEAPGFGGHPENVWDKVIVSGKSIIDQRGPGRAYDLLTGDPKSAVNPITGAEEEWRFTKTGHHCNYAIASPHLLTFRAGEAGFFDRRTQGSARLLGFRSGCRNSLIPAGGVLNAPNYAHGCICSYNMFTSLALVHVPEADLWTYNAYESPESQQVVRFGLNLGAPGARLDDNGTLWLEHPASGAPSIRVEAEVQGEDLHWFRGHTARATAGDIPWVASSGVEGLSQLTIKLPGEHNPDATYRLRLCFSEPREVTAGERSFAVKVGDQDQIALIDVVEEAGGKDTLVERVLDGVRFPDGKLRITFKASSGLPVLCGVEVTRE